MKFLIYNIVFCIAALLSVEVFYNLFLSKNKLSKLNIVRDKTVLYDLNGIYPHENQTAVYTRDAYGLRGTYSSPENIDILAVGGSATDQRFISEGLTWTDVMHQSWKYDGKNISVINAGIDGQSTLGHIKNFEWWFPFIPNLRPKFILYYIGINDLFGNVGTWWDAIEDPSVKSMIMPEEEVPFEESLFSRKALHYIREYSGIYRIYKTIHGMIIASKVKLDHQRGFIRKDIHWTDKAKSTNHHDHIANELISYKERIVELISLSKKLGAKPIIVSQAAHYYLVKDEKILGFNDENFEFKSRNVSGVDIYEYLKEFNEVAISTCKEDPECIPVDLFNELRLTTGDFYDNVHNTPDGAKKIGEFLKRKLDPIVGKN